MSHPQADGIRFQFEKLEERIAPSCLLWGTGYAAASTTAGHAGQDTAALGNVNSFDPIAMFISIFSGKPFKQATVRPTLAQPRGNYAVEDQVVMPSWAEKLLQEIHDQFNQPKTSDPNAGAVGTADRATIIEDLLATIDRELSQPVTGNLGTAVEGQAVMPHWADEFLLEIQEQFSTAANLQPNVNTNPCIGSVAKVDDLLAAIDQEFTSPKSGKPGIAIEGQSTMPTWAEEFLQEIHAELDTAKPPQSRHRVRIRRLNAS